MIRAIIIALAMSACAPTPTRLTIAPPCPQNAPGCLQAYQPHEIDVEWTERLRADHELCRAVPP